MPLRVSYERTKFPQSGNPLHFLGDGLGQTVSFTGSERVQQPACRRQGRQRPAQMVLATSLYSPPQNAHLGRNRNHKGLSSQSYGFSSSYLWMWELNHKESWAPKNWCFWTVVLEKTLESPFDCKEINLEYSLEGLMLMLKHFGHLMQRADSFIKTLILAKTEGRRRRGWQRKRWLDGITDSMDMSLRKFQEIVKDRGSLACWNPQGRKESDTTEGPNTS